MSFHDLTSAEASRMEAALGRALSRELQFAFTAFADNLTERLARNITADVRAVLESLTADEQGVDVTSEPITVTPIRYGHSVRDTIYRDDAGTRYAHSAVAASGWGISQSALRTRAAHGAVRRIPRPDGPLVYLYALPSSKVQRGRGVPVRHEESGAVVDYLSEKALTVMRGGK